MSFIDPMQTTELNNKSSTISLQQQLTSEVQTFNYTVFTPEVQSLVQSKTSELKNLIRRSTQDIIDIGQKLIEVKEQLGHGHFNIWLKAEFDWSTRTAARFMQVATQFKFANLANLNIDVSALYILAEPSTPQKARQQALELAKTGENITHNKAKSIVSLSHRQAQLSTLNPVDRTTEGNSQTLSKPCKIAQTHSQLDPTDQSNSTVTRLSTETIPTISSDNTSERRICPQENLVVVDELQPKSDNYIRILNIEHKNSGLNTNTSQIFEMTFADTRVDIEGNPESLIMLFKQMQDNPAFAKEILHEARLQSAKLLTRTEKKM